MLSLSIVAACVIGCNYAVENCPSGTSQVGGVPTSGSEQCESYSDITDIATCKTRCESPACRGNCQAFGYSDRYDRCVLYQSATIGSYNGLRDQILCSSARGSVTCPNGTEQVQGARIGTRPCQVYSGVPDIGTCKIRCDSACDGVFGPCQAFGYSAKYDRCETYRSATPGSFGAKYDRSGQILCAVTAEPTPPPQCPRGTTQIGVAGTHGLFPCTNYAVNVKSIEGCEDYCNAENPIGACCQYFSYSAVSNKCAAHRGVDISIIGVRNYPGRPLDGPDQILCRPDLECPAGTSQIGGIGAYFQNAPQVTQALYGRNIEECRGNCDHSRSCTAFAFDFSVDRHIGAEAVSVCREYRALSTDAVSTYSEGPQADQILCAVTADFSAQSSGLFSVDGMVGYSNGNGQVYVQIPAYVVYGIVALILVNIVCLMVHCWNKSKGKSKDYKTVPMRSDIDEETDIN